MESKYDGIVDLTETGDIKHAKELLKLGWKLIDTVPVNSPEEGGSYILYSFGREKEKSEQTHDESPIYGKVY